MRNILALIGLAVVSFLAVGWYRGWYQVQAQPGSPGQRRIQVDLNSDKISGDFQAGTERVGELINGRPTAPAPQQPGNNWMFFPQTQSKPTNPGPASFPGPGGTPR
jgi:hypothetical protein